MTTLIAALLFAQVVPADAPMRYVIASMANLREAPDASAKLRLKLPQSTPVIALEQKDTWTRIVAGRCQGWVQTDSLHEQQPEALWLLKEADAHKEKPVERKAWLERAAARAPWNVPALTALVEVLTALNDPALASTRAGLEVAKVASEYEIARDVDPGNGRPMVVLKDKVAGRAAPSATATVVRNYNTGDLLRVNARSEKGMVPAELLGGGTAWVDEASVVDLGESRDFLNSTFAIGDNYDDSAGSDLGKLSFFQRASRNPNPLARAHAAARLPYLHEEPKKIAESWAQLQRDYYAIVRDAAAWAVVTRASRNTEESKKWKSAFEPKVKDAIAKYQSSQGTNEAKDLSMLASAFGIDVSASKSLLGAGGLYCP